MLLRKKDERDQHRMLQAVRQWLSTHQEWLLILDNADNVALVRDFLPSQCPGHVLLTSRAQALGTLAQCIELAEMGMVESVLFLLRRAKLLAPGAMLDGVPEEQLAAAEALVIEMAFLPLAIDQAGAYVDEVGCSLSAYLSLYRIQQQELLQRRGQLPADYPNSVATTWLLSFQEVEQANSVAADLLRLCSFLDPDAIPEELFSEGGIALGPVLRQVARHPLVLDEAIEVLRKFSLIQRNPETKLLRIHRLVQVVLKNTLKKSALRRWAERAVRATHSIFPEHVEIPTWSRCLRYLSLAQACRDLIQDYAFTFEAAASLLYRTALYLRVHALYEQAEPLYRQTVFIWEQTLGPEHSNIAQALNGLAVLYREQGKHEQAEPLYQRTLTMRQQVLGAEHPDVAVSLHNLADLYKEQGKYGQVESLYAQALHIWERTLGPEHPKMAHSLNGLANLYQEQGKYEQAAALYQQALHIWEQAQGPEYLFIAYPLNNLADLYQKQGQDTIAEEMYRRALSIREQTLGSEHPGLAYSLNGLADLYQKLGKYEQAESLYERVLRIWEQTTGLDHPGVAHALHGLANLYQKQGHYEQAELLYHRTVRIWECTLGYEHPELAETLHDFATFQHVRGNGHGAASLYQRALVIREQTFGSEHPKTAATRRAYTELLQTLE